jgi:hypothetical protein
VLVFGVEERMLVREIAVVHLLMLPRRSRLELFRGALDVDSTLNLVFMPVPRLILSGLRELF